MKCLECHTEIGQRIEAGTGYHSRAYKSSPGETDCARCHAEHRGQRFELINLDRRNFNHGLQTGFPLEGKHLVEKCESCHTAAKVAASARPEIKIKDLNRSFLGLRRDCDSCHRDPHQNQLGSDCRTCHVLDAWKPASNFDHAKAAFPLTGRHRQVQCEKCHETTAAGKDAGSSRNAKGGTSGRDKTILFKGKTYGSCVNCHEDQHHGAFNALKLGGKCEKCHDTGGWKDNRPGSAFTHNLTKFQLTGKHADLACGKCHKESDFARPVPHDHCRDCHQDPHGGQFAARAGSSDCAVCHGTTQFKPALYDRTAHMQAAFPLAEKHSTVPCARCHQPEGREARYVTGKLTCAACHRDPHGGEFASDPYNNKCDTCHTAAGFENTTFSRNRHSQTRFPLTGRHAGVECQKCHKPLESAAAAAPGIKKIQDPASVSTAGNGAAVARALRQYHFTSLACATCHPDPHEINPVADLACSTCHVSEEWQTLRPFDHSQTRFKLAGSHADADHPVTCVKCHKPSVNPGSGGLGTAPVFSRSTGQCSKCHAEKDAHGGQFDGPGDGGKDCSSCHIPSAWKLDRFDHDKTRFPLSVPHRKVGCEKCHKEQRELEGKIVRVYRNTPVECLKCH